MGGSGLQAGWPSLHPQRRVLLRHLPEPGHMPAVCECGHLHGFPPCGPRGDCVCYPSWEGPSKCFVNWFLNCGSGECQSSGECDAGWACALACCGGLCMPLCGTLPNP